jgi:hypothetical protein
MKMDRHSTGGSLFTASGDLVDGSAAHIAGFDPGIHLPAWF